jgi:hypothetical protein
MSLLETHFVSALTRQADQPAFPLVVAGVAVAATLSMSVPFALLVAAVLMAPRRWRSIALCSSLGAALGAAVLYLAFHHLGWARLFAAYPEVVRSTAWADATRWLSRYGLTSLLVIAALPVPLTPALMFAAISRLSVAEVLLALWLGKLVVARIATGFGMQVLAFDPALAASVRRPGGVTLVGWSEILERSDILTLHLPVTERTRHLFAAAAFERMKPGMVLINTARGALIDETALLRAPDDGTVGAAGLDVLEQEGMLASEAPTGCRGLGCDAGWRTGDPLLSHPRVLVTPHVGFNTREAVERIFAQTAANIAARQAGRRHNRVD